VTVDLELWGCPVNKYQTAEVIAALLQQRRPNLPEYSVCLECKRQGNTCVMVAMGIPCLGPITRAGCGAICPGQHRGCYGCFGPCPSADVEAFVPHLVDSERYPGESIHLLRTISGGAPEFVKAAELIQGQEATP
jgi:coenzyme F420-reducing hydrogenase gamma subunit